MGWVPLKGQIYFIYHLLVLLFAFAIDGDATATPKEECIVLLLNEAYHHGTI